MRYTVIEIFFCLFCIVYCKTNVKTLTESNGQEIIEIDGPKELPPGLEEEPGADSDDDDDESLRSTFANTKKETTRKLTTLETRRDLKDFEKIDGTAPEDEEAKLEKELAEIYKDADYKDITEEIIDKKDTSSTAAFVNTEDTEKPIARAKSGFKFAPDTTSKKEIEKFRTSVDEINCKNRLKLSVTTPVESQSPEDQKKKKKANKPNSGNKFNASMLITQIGVLLITLVCI